MLYDWGILKSAALAWASGGNPYQIYGFFSPPWALPLLWILSWLPNWAVPLLTFGPILLLGLKFRLRWPVLCMLLISPPVISCAAWGNIDVLVLLGTIAFPAYLFSLKPQMTWACYLRRPWMLVGVGLLVLYSWPLMLPWLGSLMQTTPLASVGIWGVPVGLLLWQHPLAASIFFSPHISFSSYVGVSLVLAQRWPKVLLALNLGYWIAIALMTF
jgi:hypothetical protein